MFDKLGMTQPDSSQDHKRNSNSIDNNTSGIIARVFYNGVKYAQEDSQVTTRVILFLRKREKKTITKSGLTLGTNIYLV